jgi:formiminotetrahydrofolate cyclodeaminase
MVCGLTTGRAKVADAEDEVHAIAARLADQDSRLRDLAGEDADAYAKVVAARALPRATDGERAAREAALAHAIREATMVPLRTLAACVAVTEDLQRLLAIGNPRCRSDAGTAIALANAAVMGAYLNVRVNLPEIADEEFRTRARALIDASLLRSADAVREAFAWLNGNL